MAKENRYPRRGHPLAPATLRDILQVPIPKKYLRGKKNPSLLLCDLDETAWDRFSEDVCRQLAEEIVRTVGRNIRLPGPVQDRRLPPIPDGMTLADLDLEVRILNSLVAAGLHHRPQDLRRMTIGGALRLRGFWVKSLIGLLTSLEYAAEHPKSRRAERNKTAVNVSNLHETDRYPRLGNRLAPLTLREILLGKIPPELVRGTPFCEARLCDLDEMVWGHLSSETIQRLATLIISRAATLSDHPAIAQRRLPRLPDGMRLEDLRLGNRTYNILERKGFTSDPERLRNLTVGNLLSIQSLGVESLVDLLTALETLVAREGTLDEELTAAAEALWKIPKAWEITFSDPRLGRLLRAMDVESNTIGNMVTRLLSRCLDPPDPIGLREQIVELHNQIEKANGLSLEDELLQVFAENAKARDRQIVAEYFGWDGEGSRTLEVLKQKYGLSRERVRQICDRAIKRARNVSVYAPVLDRALAFLSSRLPKGLPELQAEFDSSGLTCRGLPIESIRRAAEFLDRTVDFVLIEGGRTQLVVHPNHAELPRLIAHSAMHVVTNYGAASLSEVMAQLAEHGCEKVDPVLVRETLQAQDNLHWLDEKRNWFRLQTSPKYGLANMIDKVLSVTGRIDVSKLRSAMARYRRHDRKLPPQRILLKFAEQMPHVRVDGNTVIADPPLDWREVLADVERTMVEILKEHGPVLERTTFEKLCLKSNMNRFSFGMSLMSSPVIERYGRNVYGLLGLKVDRATVDKLATPRSAASRPRVLIGCGERDNGNFFVAYRLSRATISGGVITMPAAMRRHLHGSFTLRMPDGRKVGTMATKESCGWGLGPVLREHGATPGQYLLLVCDASRREAEIHIGDESILNGYLDIPS